MLTLLNNGRFRFVVFSKVSATKEKSNRGRIRSKVPVSGSNSHTRVFHEAAESEPPRKRRDA